MIRALAFALAVFAASPVWAASMKIQDDGRICYNEQCLGYYDEPAEQCEPAKHATVPDLSNVQYPEAASVLSNAGWAPHPGIKPSDRWTREGVSADLPINDCSGSTPVCRLTYVDRHEAHLTIVWHRLLNNPKVVAFFRCDQAYE